MAKTNSQFLHTVTPAHSIQLQIYKKARKQKK